MITVDRVKQLIASSSSEIDWYLINTDVKSMHDFRGVFAGYSVEIVDDQPWDFGCGSLYIVKLNNQFFQFGVGYDLISFSVDFDTIREMKPVPSVRYVFIEENDNV